MKNPWQIWLIFALCMAIVMPAMGWLTIKTIQMDRQRNEDHRYAEIARLEAQLQERISSALWRLDWTLTPLIASEVARPYYAYQSFYEPQRAGTDAMDADVQPPTQPIPSPLLLHDKPYVKLHFQIEPGNVFDSPTCPADNQTELALSCGLSNDRMDSSCLMLGQAQQLFEYDQLLVACSVAVAPLMDASIPDSTDALNETLSYLGNNIGDSTNVPYEIDNRVYRQQLATNAGPTQSQQSEIDEGVPLQTDSNVTNRFQQQQIWNEERGNQELQARDRATKSFVDKEVKEKVVRMMSEMGHSEAIVREGVMRPMWIQGNLILARRVDFGTRQVIQCCWLDWDQIEKKLLEQIVDLLPVATLAPIEEQRKVQIGRALATLPVQIIAGLDNLPPESTEPLPDQFGGQWFSGIRLSIVMAWIGLLLGASAVALLLHGVITLSERRGAFVSAVTHELRTPLTTFRMYAEMLAEKMLPSDQKRQEYANTLRVEADRLSHLVENVLQFARLERGYRGGQKVTLSIAELLTSFEQRLSDRASEAGMRFCIELDPKAADQRIHTVPAAVEHILFNLVDNACKYARDAEDKRIQLRCVNVGKYCEISVSDFGPGLNRNQLRQLFKPFRKSDQEAANSAAGVGLGLALSTKLARDLNGQLTANEQISEGAQFVLRIPIR